MEYVNSRTKKVEQWMDQLIHHYQDDSYHDDNDGMDFISNHSAVAQHILTQLIESMNDDDCWYDDGYYDLLQCYEIKIHPFFHHQGQKKKVPLAVLAAYEYIICNYKKTLKDTTPKIITTRKLVLDRNNNNDNTSSSSSSSSNIENQFVQLICLDIQHYSTLLTNGSTNDEEDQINLQNNPIPILLQLLGLVYNDNNERRRKYFLEEYMIWIFVFFCSSSSPSILPNLSLEQWIQSHSSNQYPLPKQTPSTTTTTTTSNYSLLYPCSNDNFNHFTNFKILQKNRQSAESLLRHQVLPTITSNNYTATSLKDIMNILLTYVTSNKNPESVYMKLRHYFFQHTTKQQRKRQHTLTDLSSSPVSDSYVLVSSLQMLSYLSSTDIQIYWEHVIPIYYTILDYQYECRPSYLRYWACHLFYQQLLQDTTTQLQIIQLENTHLLLQKIFPTTILPTISEEDDVHRNDDSHVYAHYLCQLWSQIVIHSSNNKWKQEAFQQMCLVIQKCFIHKQRRKKIIRSILLSGISTLLYNSMINDQIIELGRVGLQTLLPLLVSSSLNENDDEFVNTNISCVCLNHLLVCASDTMEHHGNKIMTCLLHNIYYHQAHRLFRHTAAMALIICGTRAKQLCDTILMTTTSDTDDVLGSFEKIQSLQIIVKDIQSRAKQIQSQAKDYKVHQQ